MTDVTPVAETDGYTPKVVARVENGIGWMIFSNPRRRNAVTYNMWQQIPGIINQFERNDSVRVVALRGEGTSSFISGADISEFAEKRNTPEQVETYDAAGKAAGEAIAGLLLSLIHI